MRRSLSIHVVAGGLFILIAIGCFAFLAFFGDAAVVLVVWYTAFLPTLAVAVGHGIARNTGGAFESSGVTKYGVFSFLISLFVLPLWIVYYLALLVGAIALTIHASSFRIPRWDTDPASTLARSGMIFPAAVAAAAVIASLTAGWPGFVLFFSGIASAWAIVGLEMIALAWLDLETDRPTRTRRTMPGLNRTPLFVAVMTSALASGFVFAAAGRGELSGDLFVTTVIVPGAVGITHLCVWALTGLSDNLDTS